MKQQTMVAMMTTKRRMDEAMPAKVVGLQGRKEGEGENITQPVVAAPQRWKTQIDDLLKATFYCPLPHFGSPRIPDRRAAAARCPCSGRVN